MSTKKLPTSRRTFVKGTAATAAIAPFFIGRSAKAKAPIKWKGATVAPKGTIWEKTASKMSKKLRENSGGEVDVRIVWGGGAGGETQTLKACKDGRIDLWAGSCGAASSVVSELGVFELPYLFSSSKIAQRAMATNRKMVHDLLWDNGFKLVMFSENGYRSLGTKGFVAETPADLKGRKIRIQESKIHKNLFNAWGASGVPMSITEVLPSLQTGVIDGADNSALFTQAAGLQLALTDWTVTKHIYQPAVILISKKTWDKVPAEMQTAIALDSDDMMKIQNRSFRGVRSLAPQLIQNFKDMGVNVHEPDLGPWRKAAGGVHDKFRKSTSKQGVALLDAIKKAT